MNKDYIPIPMGGELTVHYRRVERLFLIACLALGLAAAASLDRVDPITQAAAAMLVINIFCILIGYAFVPSCCRTPAHRCWWICDLWNVGRGLLQLVLTAATGDAAFFAVCSAGIALWEITNVSRVRVKVWDREDDFVGQAIQMTPWRAPEEVSANGNGRPV